MWLNQYWRFFIFRETQSQDTTASAIHFDHHFLSVILRNFDDISFTESDVGDFQVVSAVLQCPLQNVTYLEIIITTVYQLF